jgi:hypothetical protein
MAYKPLPKSLDELRANIEREIEKTLINQLFYIFKKDVN